MKYYKLYSRMFFSLAFTYALEGNLKSLSDCKPIDRNLPKTIGKLSNLNFSVSAKFFSISRETNETVRISYDKCQRVTL